MSSIEKWKLFLSPFLFLYCSILFLFVVPPNVVSSSVIPVLEPIYDSLGLSQSWRLFAPEVDNRNTQIFALITFADGQTAMLPLPENEPFPQRALHFKQRQWLHDLVPRMNSIWPETAEYVALKNWNENNPPTLVSLVCAWTQIRTPAEKSDGKHAKAGVFTFYTRAFAPQELN